MEGWFDAKLRESANRMMTKEQRETLEYLKKTDNNNKRIEAFIALELGHMRAEGEMHEHF